MTVAWRSPRRRVAPGQAVVLYDGDEVVGGGPAWEVADRQRALTVMRLRRASASTSPGRVGVTRTSATSRLVVPPAAVAHADRLRHVHLDVQREAGRAAGHVEHAVGRRVGGLRRSEADDRTPREQDGVAHRQRVVDHEAGGHEHDPTTAEPVQRPEGEHAEAAADHEGGDARSGRARGQQQRSGREAHHPDRPRERREQQRGDRRSQRHAALGAVGGAVHEGVAGQRRERRGRGEQRRREQRARPSTPRCERRSRRSPTPRPRPRPERATRMMVSVTVRSTSAAASVSAQMAHRADGRR